MASTTDEPRVAELDAFAIAGLSLRGTEDADFRALWDEFDDRRAEFERRAVADETFSATFDADESTGEFTYVAGVAVDADGDVSAADGLPEDATVIDVPGGPYAVAETTVEDIEDTYEWLMEEWVDRSEFAIRDAPFLERYGSEWGSDASFEVLVPVAKP